MKNLLDKYSIVILTEIKTSLKISCTGFTVFQHPAKQGHRGGVAVMLKPSVAKYVRKLDRSYENVISFELEIVPDVVFVGCYIAPSDSPYYDAAVFGYLQGLLKKDESKYFFIMGDLNSRVGIPADVTVDNEKLSYEGCEDRAVNKNGKCLLQLCEDTSLVVVNNLKFGGRHFKSNLSFRKKANWISETDIMLASESCLRLVESFNMVQRFENKLLYSDHALLEFKMDVTRIRVSMELLKARALALGKSVYENVPVKVEKSLRLAECNSENVSLYFAQNPPPVLHGNENIDIVVKEFNRTVTEVLKQNKEVRTIDPSEWGNKEKWTKLLRENDQKKIWKSINWDGSINEIQADSPTDLEFKQHFEQLLNPKESENEESLDVSDAPYIPVLDDPITESEVKDAADTCKESKSYIGITPAIFKCLPITWISFLTQLLNLVFCGSNLVFPIKWCYNKLVVLFKKGLRLCCGNYRGLSIGDTICKLYGKILGNRLKLWMHIENCQAGGQEKRGCIEQVLGLRLIIDYAKKERKKLFIVFVDFSKAYDRVPRRLLFKILKDLGCGKRFLLALMAIYKNTVNILNSEYVRSTIGVKQGGPMSCLLFIIYLNVLAVMLKLIGNDSFLMDVHALMLMDDTVLLATSRKKMIEKFTILMDFCIKYGMVVNDIKTNLMVINGVKKDRESFVVYNVTVKHTTSYVYLGSPFTENGNMNCVLKLHVKTRMKDLNKFKIFCVKNDTMPFVYKKKILEAVITTSLLYGCESWLTDKVKVVETLYIGAVKSLLGVRETTRSDTVLIEAGMPSAKELIRRNTTAFSKKELLGEHAEETPLRRIYKICEQKRTYGYKFIEKLISPNAERISSISEIFANEAGSKALIYKEINPELKVHPVYRSKEYIIERERLVFTRFRLSSHHLKIETGRWARIDAEERLCGCGLGVENEAHVLFDCPKTEEIRVRYNVNREIYRDVAGLMDEMDDSELVSFVYKCMQVFK